MLPALDYQGDPGIAEDHINLLDIGSWIFSIKLLNKSRSEPGNATRIGIGHREVVCQK